MQIQKLRSQAEKLELERQALIDNSDQKRNELVAIAELGQDGSLDEYYSKHEKLSGEIVGLQQTIEQSKQTLSDLQMQTSYLNGLKSQWFGKAPAKVKPYNGPVELADLERESAERQERDPADLMHEVPEGMVAEIDVGVDEPEEEQTSEQPAHRHPHAEPHEEGLLKECPRRGWRRCDGHQLQGPPQDRKSTRLNSSHVSESRMPSSA